MVVWCPIDIWGKSVLSGGNVKGKALTWEVRERGGGTGQCWGEGATHIIVASYRVWLGPLTFPA